VGGRKITAQIPRHKRKKRKVSRILATGTYEGPPEATRVKEKRREKKRSKFEQPAFSKQKKGEREETRNAQVF